MRKLLGYLGDYRRESVLAPLLKLAESLMDLLVPLVVARIIDAGVTAGDEGVIWRSFALLVALAILGMAFSFAAQWMAAKASVGFATKLRQSLFDHIQTLSYAELDALGTNTLITRMTSDVNQIQNGLNLALRLLLRSPFIVFGAMVAAFVIDVPCALVFAVAIPLLALVVFGIMLRSIPLFTQVQSRLDQLLGLTRQNLTGVRVIRAFCKEQDETDEFDRQNEMLTRINERVGRLSALMNPGTYLIINAATIWLVWQGALRVEMGALTQGDVVALYNYMAQIVVELVKLASLIITINKSLACARRVQEMLDVEPSMTYPASLPSTEPDTAYAVRFRDVSFSYASSGEPVLEDISFAARRGQTIGIIGGTGSGKTTLIQLIARFYDATAGTVEVDGIDVRAYPAGALVQRLGIVPQKSVLFEGTIKENLQWGNENATDDELMDAVALAQATEVVLGKDGQLDARIEQGGRNLSGGQRQRLCIARALVRKPQLLVLDDADSALDQATGLALRKALAKLPASTTVFVVSQRTSSVRDADQILVLDDGTLADVGTHEELLGRCEVYMETHYSQFPEERPDHAQDPTERPGHEQSRVPIAKEGRP